ncbi:MAG: G/U mismatch-specific DNA glycosylase [Chloroflexi bacterium]|jgi:TDG/mug DNA glycosylase family protein|nr:G/U mismatch-specific DNA glycosylase [Chloroflexota bacterium]
MNEEKSRRPNRSELQAAAGKTVNDVIAPGLKGLFCGINPGLFTAWMGHHFARPGNRFWPAIHAAGITPRLLHPPEEQELLRYGYGITNVVQRATARADELSREEYVQGGERLVEKVMRYRPGVLAILGLGAYRTAFGRPNASVGLQSRTIDGVPIWLLPNPSGLNAHYQLADLARLLRELDDFATAQAAATNR